jgi:hypothetical protein
MTRLDVASVQDGPAGRDPIVPFPVLRETVVPGLIDDHADPSNTVGVGHFVGEPLRPLHPTVWIESDTSISYPPKVLPVSEAAVSPQLMPVS